jgi:hypothetical protein
MSLPFHSTLTLNQTQPPSLYRNRKDEKKPHSSHMMEMTVFTTWPPNRRPRLRRLAEASAWTTPKKGIIFKTYSEIHSY